MTLSKYEDACKILNIVVYDENELTEIVLKRQYHKCCLMYHPDKNNQIQISKFLEISEAYDFLRKYMGFIDDENYDEFSGDEQAVWNPYVSNVGKYILHNSKILLSNKYVTSYVDDMDDNCNFKRIYKILQKYRY